MVMKQIKDNRIKTMVLRIKTCYCRPSNINRYRCDVLSSQIISDTMKTRNAKFCPNHIDIIFLHEGYIDLQIIQLKL